MTKKKDANSGGAVPAAPPPRSLDDLRLSEDVLGATDITANSALVKCDKPPKAAYFRSHPELYTSKFALYEHESGMKKQNYLIAPSITELEGVARRTLLQVIITRQGQIILWPLKLTPADGTTNTWNESALGGRDVSLTSWIRMWSDQPNGQYTWRVAPRPGLAVDRNGQTPHG